MIRNFKGFAPKVALSAYIDPSAQVIGDVVIGERSSIWPCASLRGDISGGYDLSIARGLTHDYSFRTTRRPHGSSHHHFC